MTNILLLSIKTRFTILANRLISFFSRIPLIREVIKPRIYGQHTAKIAVAVVGSLFVVVWKVFSRLFYVMFLTLFGLTVFYAIACGGYRELFATILADDPLPLNPIASDIALCSLTAWFYLSFIGGFLDSTVISVRGHDNTKMMISYMRSNPSLFARARILLTILSDILLYSPCVIVAFSLSAIPYWCALPMLLMYVAARCLGESFNMLVFKHTKWTFGKFPLTLAYLPVLAAAVFIPVYWRVINWDVFLRNPLVSAASVAIIAGAWLYIRRYKSFGELIRDRISQTEQMLDRAKKVDRKALGSLGAASNLSASKWYKQQKPTAATTAASGSPKPDALSNKRGFSYLNAIFFSRHSKFFRKKVFLRCAYAIAPLVIVAGVIAYSYINGEPLQAATKATPPFRFSPVFFFIMYIASMGRVVTAAVFTNCDIHMLHYTYYRTFDTTIASFRSRFSVILRYNMIISATVAVSMLGSIRLIYGSLDGTNSVVFTLLMFFIGVLFAFNDLFLYYVIQPYDGTGVSKSIAYKFINSAIYIVAYINLNLRLDLYGYTFFVAALTALYLCVGMAVLKKVAPKRFKLR